MTVMNHPRIRKPLPFSGSMDVHWSAGGHEAKMLQWCWRHGHTHILELMFLKTGTFTCTRRLDLALECPYPFSTAFALRRDIPWSTALTEEEIVFALTSVIACLDVAPENLKMILRQDILTSEAVHRLYQRSCDAQRRQTTSVLLHWMIHKNWIPTPVFFFLHTPGKWIDSLLPIIPDRYIDTDYLVQACRMGSQTAIMCTSHFLERARGYEYARSAWMHVMCVCTRRELGIWTTLLLIFKVAVKKYRIDVPEWLVDAALSCEHGEILAYLPDHMIPCPSVRMSSARFFAELVARKGKAYCTNHPAWTAILDTLVSNACRMMCELRSWCKQDATYTLRVASSMTDSLNELEEQIRIRCPHQDLFRIIDEERVRRQMFSTTTGPFTRLPQEIVQHILDIEQ